MTANETYLEAKRQFSDRNRAVLIYAQSPHKWWSTLKSAVFGTNSSLPPLVSEGGGLVYESIGKADLLSDHFEQSSEAVDLPLTCHPSPSLTTFAFRSRGVRRLLLDLDPQGDTDPLGMFPIFLKRTADVMAPRLIACSASAACSSEWFPVLLETGQCHSNSEGYTVLFCCQLPTNFHTISIVQGI